MGKIRWGILGTGAIARRFAKSLTLSKTGTLHAIASREETKARALASEFRAPRAYGRYDDLLADPGVDAVYISTPHPAHAEWAIRSAEAGKHILCEKPMTLNAQEAEAVISAVRKAGVFFMEAFMYRCHPQTRKLVELIHTGAIGKVQLIQATFGFRVDYKPTNRLFANHLGGGAILDVGCYCTSMARLLAGAANGRDFADPVSVKGDGILDPIEGTDWVAAALLEFPGKILAQLNTSILLDQGAAVRVFGSEGSITVTQPWFAGSKGARLVVEKSRPAKHHIIKTESKEDLYACEIDLVAKHLVEGQAPAMVWNDSLGNMRTLDAWRREVGVVYAGEKSQPE